MTPRTPQRYMRLANIPADKYDTVSHLGINVALDTVAAVCGGRAAHGRALWCAPQAPYGRRVGQIRIEGKHLFSVRLRCFVRRARQFPIFLHI
jgi:hypothetical protein